MPTGMPLPLSRTLIMSPGSRVVDYFVHKVVKPARACGADIHAGALADRLQPLKHLYLACVVFFCNGRVHRFDIIFGAVYINVFRIFVKPSVIQGKCLQSILSDLLPAQ
jgi:hypothetical protein